MRTACMGRKWRAWWLCSLLVTCMLARSAAAQSDRRLVWRSLETPHFRIHYHEPLGVLARVLAEDAEAIHARVTGSLGLAVAQTVEVVLSDESDAANGLASGLPYNVIRLRAAAPDDLSPLADYDDWPSMLLTHEHTHITHFEQAGGLPWLLRKVFGRLYSPQGYLPGWFIEGLATRQETLHSSGGRGRGTTFDMYLRMAALEGRFLGLDWIGFDGEPWPHGNVRYVYGQAFVAFIAERYGDAALGRFVREYGRRIVPYGVNRALRRTTGKTFVALYEEFRRAQHERADATRRAVEARGRVEGRKLTAHGELTRSPRYLDDHTLAYVVADARDVADVRALSLRTGSAQRVARVSSVGQVAHVPNTQRVLYSAVDFHRGAYAYNELYVANLDSRRGGRQLTRGMRAREPDVSPDGRQVAFVTQSAGSSHLEVAALDDLTRTRRTLVRSARFEQVYTPRWSRDGTRIAYSAHQRGGYRDIWVLEVATGTRTRITFDRALDRGPVFSRDGATLYFSSDRSGIDNLYAYDFARGALTQLTDVLGGALQPDVSPDGTRIAYVGYGARGFDLHELALADAAMRPAGPALVRPPARPLPIPRAQPSTAYQPLRTLWPRYFEIATEEASAGTRVVLTTNGADAVGFHGWSLRGHGVIDARDRGLDASYAYRKPRFPVLTYGSYRTRQRRDLIARGTRRTYTAHEGSLGVGTVFWLPQPLYALRFRVDYVLDLLQTDAPLRVPLDPNYPPPQRPVLGFGSELRWSATYDSTQRQAFDVSRSWGQLVSVGGSYREPAIGGRTRGYAISYRAEQFVRVGPRAGVVAFAYTGAFEGYQELGGYPSRLTPLDDALIGTRGAPGDYARLRGFPSRTGDTLQVGQLEYRLLLSRINRGYDTLPVFARRVHGAMFADAGDAWTRGRERPRFSMGLGAELRLDWSAHYGNDYTLRAGVARGVTRGGELQWYTTLATPF